MSATPHTRHVGGRFRLDGSPEWFDLITSTEAARILAETPTAPLNFRKLDSLRSRGFIELADDSAATGPRFYRGDVERYARIPLEPPADPLAPARGVLTAIMIGAGLVALAIGVYVAVTR